MDKKIEYMNEFFKYLTQENGTEENQTFFALLKMLRNNSNLSDYYGEEFVELLRGILPRIEDKYDKATLIETIVECCYIDYTFDEHYWQGIFEQYIWCVRENASSVENISICLVGFIRTGISKNEVFTKLAENLQREYAILILAQINLNDLGNIPEELSGLLIEARKAYSIRWRTGIIAQFLLLVHPLVRKYAGISEITFLYDDYRGVYEDCWPRGLLNTKDTLVAEKMLSLKEVSILEKLDQVLGKADLDSMEVRKLYDEFFEGKDPLDVIYMLPE
ncbi:hypothetical protein [Paenibacillus sp. 481]|uniref:hypothetical protein n=1 Tax=Paenibacillus sp. 481 TaxID=2835869 RepID=UPI001E46DC60|nr:hypothetical protein [Paenibacillus sp. 481]UHA73173.1 hypothetical protein KIK04_21705 [Paenibacillus sp. 481]